MKWAALIVGALALLVATIAIIGSRLPKSHTASRTVRFRRSAEEIFDTVSDYRSFPSWRAEVKSVQDLPDGRRGWIGQWSCGSRRAEEKGRRRN